MGIEKGVLIKNHSAICHRESVIQRIVAQPYLQLEAIEWQHL